MTQLSSAAPRPPFAQRLKAGPLVAYLLPLSLLVNACSDSSEGDARPLNVLLVTLDTTRADRLSCYGYKKQTTPRIDGLAAKGTRFERTIATAGITPMSHSAILTGLNNYRHGLRVFHSENVSHKLSSSVETLPEILQTEGWRTGAMVSSYPVSEHYGLDRGFETFDTGLDLSQHDYTGQQKHADAWLDGTHSSGQRRGDATVDQALTWLDEGLGIDAPWCLWVHMFDVHDFSIVPPEAFMTENGFPMDKSAALQSPEWRERMYDPELTYMDLQVGRLLDWISDNEQDENTVVVITADHGQGLLDGFKRHRWIKHRLLYDWCLRVPLIVRVPGAGAGVVVENQVRTIDIMPTVLEALGIPGPNVEGESALALMRGGQESEPRLAYADALNLVDEHSPGKRLPPGCNDNLFCVTDGKWKMIYHEEAPQFSELYNLEEDPDEVRNVAGNHPNRMRRLKAFLDERGAMELQPPEPGSESAPDAASLKGLGYAGDGEEEDESSGSATEDH